MIKYLTVMGFVVCFANQGEAVTLFWDAGNPTGDGAITAGDGDWTATTINFSDASGLANNAYVDGESLIFGDVGSTVNLTDVFAPMEINFTVDGYTLTGAGSISTTGGLTIDVTNIGDTALLDVDLSGSGGLTVIGGGTLKTTGTGSSLGSGIVTNSGILEIGGDNTVANYTSNNGTLNGSSVLTASTYNLTDSIVNAGLGTGSINTNGEVELNFVNLGNLNVITGTTTLRGNNGGDVNISSRAVLIAGSQSLSNGGEITNAGTLTLDGNQSVEKYISTGTVIDPAIIDGTGTLTATDYELGDNSIVNANLGAGNIITSGVVDINGTSAGDLEILSGGVTTLAGANSGNVDITRGGTLIADVDGVLFSGGVVQNYGVLTLNGDQTITTYESGDNPLTPEELAESIETLTFRGIDLEPLLPNMPSDLAVETLILSLIFQGGVTNGSGTLTAETYNLNDGSVVTANLGLGEILTNDTVQIGGSVAGNIEVVTGTTVLSGTLSGNLDINEDSVFSTVAGGLGSNINVNNDGTLSLQGDETISTYTSTGTVVGVGTLTADTYNINDGSVVEIALGTGNIITNGNILFTFTTAGNLEVQSGTTTLSAANSGDLVSILNGATLDVGAGMLSTSVDVVNAGTLNLVAEETFGTYTATGVVNGPGTLTATTYNINDGADVNLALGAGTINTNGAVTFDFTTAGDLHVMSGTTTLAAENTGSTITIDSGATLNPAIGTLNQTPDVTNNGTLNLSEDLTVASYIAAGTLNGDFLLTAPSYTLNDGAIVNSNLSTGDITATGAVEINGTSIGNIDSNGDIVINGDSLGDINADGTIQVNGDSLGDIIASGEILINGVSEGDITVSGTTAINGISAGNINVLSGSTTLTANNSGNINISNGASFNPSSNTLSSDAIVTNAGTFNLQGSQTVDSYQGSGGTLSGSGVFNSNSFQAGNIVTTLLSADALSLSVNAASVTLGSGSQLTLSGDGVGLSLLDEFDLFAGSGTITGSGAASGFGSFDVSGLATDIEAVFNVQTGNIIIVNTPTNNLDAESKAVLLGILGADPDSDSVISNVDGINALSQGTIDRINTLVNGSSTATIDSYLKELSPNFYSSLLDYSAYQHLSYKKSLEYAPHVIKSGQWELALGFQSQDIEKEVNGDRAEYQFQGSGAYLGVYNNVSERAKIGVFGAYDTGSIDSALANFDAKGTVFGLRTEFDLSSEATSNSILSFGVSAGSFSFDGERKALGLINTVNEIDSSTLDLDVNYKFTLFNNEFYRLSPFIGVNHIMVDVDKFNESGTSNSLRVNDLSKDMTFITVGAEGQWRPNAGPFGFTGKVAFSKNLADDTNEVSAALANNDAFSVSSNGIIGDMTEVRVGVFFDLTERGTVDFSYFSLSSDDLKSASGFGLSYRHQW